MMPAKRIEHIDTAMSKLEQELLRDIQDEQTEQAIALRQLVGEMKHIVNEVRVRWSIEPLSLEQREQVSEVRAEIEDFVARLTQLIDEANQVRQELNQI